jgi:hypothetical protein
MNIRDKKQFYKEITRVLKPGGRFIYYDILSAGAGTILYPVPWAGSSSLSHLITSTQLNDLLTQGGLQSIKTNDETIAGIDFFHTMLERIKTQGLPPVSLRLLMGESFLQKTENLYNNLKNGLLMLESGTFVKGELSIVNMSLVNNDH